MARKILLDFNHHIQSSYYENNGDIVINLYGLICHYSKISDIKKMASLDEKLLFISSYEMFYQGFRKYLTEGHRLSYSEHRKLRDIITEIYGAFAKLEQQSWLAPKAPLYDFTQKSALRYGIVELRVIENYLYNPKEFELNFFDTLRNIKQNKFIPKNPESKLGHWLSVDDVAFNIQSLMTNAGYYLNLDEQKAYIELQEWCEIYLKAISNSPLFVCPEVYPFSLPTIQHIHRTTGTLHEQLIFPYNLRIYDILKDKNILFITPFAKLISKQYNSGNIFKLYKHRSIPEFKITTIDMPLTFYPNRPGASWKDTYQQCCDQINNYLSKEKFDLFTASAGCYGIPLCSYVSQNHAINTMYFGNYTNTLFGISQQCSKNFMSEHLNLEAWVAGDLGQRCPQVKNIDGGRYL